MIDQRPAGPAHTLSLSALPLSHTTTSGRPHEIWFSKDRGRGDPASASACVECLVFAGASNAGCGQKARFLVQSKNNRCPQICSFTACGGGVSGVSLVGSVGICEVASQCGDGKGSVLPMGGLALLAGLLFACQKARKSVLCVCERDVVKPTGKAGQCRTAAAVRW